MSTRCEYEWACWHIVAGAITIVDERSFHFGGSDVVVAAGAQSMKQYAHRMAKGA